MANTKTTNASAKWKENFKPEWHNLFLSHAGEDKAFVRMLHEGLKKCNHNPFLDKKRDSLPCGSHFPTTILDAVRKCQIIVFVLSEHFVTKKWPMLELVEAWRLPESNRPLMFPVFYKLSVGNIDETSLKTWCKIWEKQAEKDPEVDIDAFKQALRDLTKHSGVLNSGDLEDYKFAKRVVSEICRQVTPIKPWINETIQKGEEFCRIVAGHLMLVQGGKYRFLGMWGSNGSGKTWIATAVCRHFYTEYGGWVALIDCSKKDKLGMARALYCALSNEKWDKRNDSETQARNHLLAFVKEKSFFVVLDHLPWTQDGKDIADFALELLKQCKECKVLITARNKTFLDTLLEPYNDYAKAVTEVPKLDKDAAANILLGLACPNRKWNSLTSEEQTAVHKVCESHLEDADFHPLLIKVLGSHISRLGKESEEPTLWPALLRTDATLTKDLYSKLFLLVDDQFQSMTASHLQPFCIDAALYDEAIETTVHGICNWLSIIHGCRPQTVLKKLQEVARRKLVEWDGWDKSGADVVDDFDDNEDPEILTNNMFAKFAMRQVLENPEKWGWFFYSGIAEEEETEVALQDDTAESKHEFAPPRPKEVKKIEKIALVGGKFQDVGEVLNLMHYTKAVAMVIGRCNEMEELNVEWNTRLKVLEVEACENLQNIEGLEDLTHLVCLRVVFAPITKVALRLGKLWRLQTLEICDTKISKAPCLQGCFNLRKLILECNLELRSLPECWRGFSRLTKISFAYNIKIVDLPDLSPLACVLCNLDISYCVELKSAKCIPSLTSLQTFVLDDCSALILQVRDLQPLKNLRRNVSTPSGLHPETKQAWLSVFRADKSAEESYDEEENAGEGDDDERAEDDLGDDHEEGAEKDLGDDEESVESAEKDLDDDHEEGAEKDLGDEESVEKDDLGDDKENAEEGDDEKSAEKDLGDGEEGDDEEGAE